MYITGKLLFLFSFIARFWEFFSRVINRIIKFLCLYLSIILDYIYKA